MASDDERKAALKTFDGSAEGRREVERIDGKVALTNAFRKLTNCGID